MKSILFILLQLALITVYKAQETKYPETVIIKTFESYGNTGVDETDTKIITFTPDNTAEVKTLAMARFSRSDFYQVYTDNQKKIKTEIQKWRNMGFSVKTSDSVLLGAAHVTTIMMEKD